MTKINSAWISHLKGDKEAIQKFTQTVLGSSLVLDRLSDILESKMAEREVFKEVDFKDPSWAYMAADRNGYLRALKDIHLILNMEGKDQ